ncbi:MAG TPA: tRNA uridine-5-carboxymethylaminomethyl(34) synthesis GTPase MnmE [Planctomycetaceae bacterium]|nr:tRNA uridine-5-carboxymethylaminomethyl(34) synthesis GTPase MnmE [Blastopirellula sp.]HAY81537.1 tRNA uridine-5-carboxymethylaminomethyl(34) synthesis GTPase MnmE [Planctomycetaceae bacterium]
MRNLHDTTDTIVAIGSASGGGVRGVVRVSGENAIACVAKGWQPNDGGELSALTFPQVVQGELWAGSVVGLVPVDLYVWPTRRSYTRQPSVEIHTVGSTAVLNALTTALCEAGARLAEPGEFTMRAFLAGRMDLTQAEAVLGVIDADSEKELDVALRQLGGGMRNPLDQLRDRLLDLLAHLEAGLDFVEEDIEFVSHEELLETLRDTGMALDKLAAEMQARTAATSEHRVVLRGRPNAGKSCLFNALVGENAAIVSDVSGTTRDYLMARKEIDGVPLVMVDTAGIDEIPVDAIDRRAQQMSVECSADAHLELLCVDASQELTDWDHQAMQERPAGARIVVLTKCDVGTHVAAVPQAIETSALTGAGMEDLQRTMLEHLAATSDVETSVVLGTSLRCRESLRRARDSAQRAVRCADEEWGEELVAAEIRATLDELGKVVGAVYTDDILDRIFSRFCIGK